ncbi:MAG: hypothetical protein H7256_01165 [Bdellovibrio sp.]|nr:hypothetical protein [Bdellovibrio sp.]
MQLMPELQNDLSVQSDVSRFKKLTEDVAFMLNENRAEVVAYRDPSMNSFSMLDQARQKNSLKEIEFYKKSLEMAVSEDRTINEKQSLWSSLKLLGLRPTSDVLDLVNSEDSVEAYDLGGIQFWRNFKFFEVCSYTLEEMFSLPWSDRYDRDDVAVKKTEEIAMNLITGKMTETIYCNIENILVENLSENKFVIDARHTHISPLFDQYSAVSGFIVVSKVKLLGADNTNNLPTAGLDLV